MGKDEPSSGNGALHAALQALGDSEAIHRAIVESIPQKLFLKDCSSVYLAINSPLAASLGRTPEQVVGKDDFALVPAELADKYRADDRAVIESGQAKDMEERYVAQGKEYWVRTFKTPVRNAAGEVIAVLGLFEDITEQKRAANVLEASEKRYRRLFESAKDGILILDADSGCIVDVNPFLEQLTGYSHEEFLGRHLWEIGAFKDIAASREAFVTLQTEKYVRYEHLPLKARDGRRIDVEFVSNVYRVDNQNVIQCNIRDITAWKRVEIERNRLMRAIEQTAEMVVVTNASGNIVYANPAFETVTGYAHAEVLGQSPRLLKSGVQDDAFYRAMWATISGGGTWHGRMVNKKKDGTLYTAEATISPVREAAGAITSYVAVERDISARLVLEAQFLQAQRMESIGRLAGGVAHDFNNLVTVILSYTALALEQLRDGDPLKDDLLEVTGAGERAAALTRQLLAFGRKQVLQPVALDLNQVLGDMENMLRRIIGEDIELVWAPQSTLGLVRADPGQLEQVLMNLVVNARDAMPDGGRLTIETVQRGDRRDVRRASRGRRARALRHAFGQRHGLGHGRGDPDPHLRSVLHHQGQGQRDGPGPFHGARHRDAERRLHLGLQRAWPGNDVQGVSAAGARVLCRAAQRTPADLGADWNRDDPRGRGREGTAQGGQKDPGRSRLHGTDRRRRARGDRDLRAARGRHPSAPDRHGHAVDERNGARTRAPADAAGAPGPLHVGLQRRGARPAGRARTRGPLPAEAVHRR